MGQALASCSGCGGCGDKTDEPKDIVFDVGAPLTSGPRLARGNLGSLTQKLKQHLGAIIKIQSWYRGHRVRKRYPNVPRIYLVGPHSPQKRSQYQDRGAEYEGPQAGGDEDGPREYKEQYVFKNGAVYKGR